MDSRTITLLSFGHFDRALLEKISEAVAHEFNCMVTVKETRLDLTAFFDPSRRQYNGNLLLKEVEAMSLPTSTKTIGLFNVDLFIPILTYIFGQAQLGGPTAIASIYRLSNEKYGMLPDENLVFERFKKEIIHELGHTFKLLHCHSTSCVMYSSTYVEDIDQKEAGFCPKCR
ncbi:MAG: archaemetzincin family Zn-dependent metalloprotease, partial [Bacteroidales bacterium]